MKTWRWLVVAMMVAGMARGQTVRTWDGGGDANASGNWSVAANWSGDNVPDTSDERAVLGSVTVSGTRTVTNDAAHSIHSLHMSQSGAGGINRLQLDANLTLATPTGHSEFLFTLSDGAGVENIVVDFNGRTIAMSRNQHKVSNLRGTWDLTVSGSKLQSTAGNDRLTIESDGHLKMGAGSEIDIGRASGLDYFINLGQTTFEGAGVSQIGRETNLDSGTFYVGSSSATGATFTVGDGNDGPTARLRHANVFMTNFAGNTVTVNAGSTLELRTVIGQSSDTKTTRITNEGDFEQAGTIRVLPNQWNLSFQSDKNDIINRGTWTISGQDAEIVRAQLSGGATPASGGGETNRHRIFIDTTGIMAGDGKLTYNNTTGQSTLNFTTLTNAGLITPGASAGETGTLEISNAHVTFAEGGELRIEIGGASAGEYDVFKMNAGTYGGTLNLSAANTKLSLDYIGSYRAPAGTQWTVIAAKNVVGDFAIKDFPENRFSMEWVGNSLVVTALPPKGTVISIE